MSKLDQMAWENLEEQKEAKNEDQDESDHETQKWNHEKQMAELRKIRDKMTKAKQAWKYMEDEAELGSDNEDNDDHVKQVDDNDDDEDLNQDLKELINNNREDGDEGNALAKFMADQKELDKELFKTAY